MMIKYVALDTETGGLDPIKHSLLTGYFEVLDENFNTVDSLFFAVKDDPYRVCAAAMEVNKINLVNHDKIADSKVITEAKIHSFFKKLYFTEKLIPIGQNIAFDQNFLNYNFPSLKEFISHRVLDTQIIARYLQINGKIPSENSCSLRSLAGHFNVEDKYAHTADGDVKVTIEVLKKMMAL